MKKNLTPEKFVTKKSGSTDAIKQAMHIASEQFAEWIKNNAIISAKANCKAYYTLIKEHIQIKDGNIPKVNSTIYTSTT